MLLFHQKINCKKELFFCLFVVQQLQFSQKTGEFLQGEIKINGFISYSLIVMWLFHQKINCKKREQSNFLAFSSFIVLMWLFLLILISRPNNGYFKGNYAVFLFHVCHLAFFFTTRRSSSQPSLIFHVGVLFFLSFSLSPILTSSVV